MKFAPLLVLLALTSPAHSANLYKAERYTCTQLKWLLKKENVIRVESGWWGGYFASKSKYCPSRHKTQSIAYFQVKNRKWCGLGLYCVPQTKP